MSETTMQEQQPTTVRAKFRVTEETTTEYQGSKRVKLAALSDDGIEENRLFARATPWGEIQMQIDNPSAAEVFKPGKVFYLDFTPAD